MDFPASPRGKKELCVIVPPLQSHHEVSLAALSPSYSAGGHLGPPGGDIWTPRKGQGGSRGDSDSVGSSIKPSHRAATSPEQRPGDTWIWAGVARGVGKGWEGWRGGSDPKRAGTDPPIQEGRAGTGVGFKITLKLAQLE